MKIQYFGHSCFLLEDRAGTRIVTDPYGGIGFELPKGLSADAVAVSHGHSDHNNLGAVGGNPILFTEEGEYRIGNISVRAVKRFHDEVRGKKRGHTLVFHFLIDGIDVCHFGDLGEPCTPESLSAVSPANVALIPVGGYYTIDAAEAKKYVEALKPDVVIPMHYKVEGLRLPIAPVSDFTNLFEKSSIEPCSGEIELNLSHLPKKIFIMERNKLWK